MPRHSAAHSRRMHSPCPVVPIVFRGQSLAASEAGWGCPSKDCHPANTTAHVVL